MCSFRSAASRLREARVAIVTLVTNVTPGSIVTIVTLGVLANGSSMVKSCIFRHSSLRYARDHVAFSWDVYARNLPHLFGNRNASKQRTIVTIVTMGVLANGSRPYVTLVTT